jgi:hypothetical protein
MKLRKGRATGGDGGLLCVALAAVALVVAAVGGPTLAGADNGWERCGRAEAYGGHFVYARDVGCKKARRVARKVGERLGECIEEGCQAADFACRAKPNEIEGGTIVCSRGEQRVRFGYGG